MYIQLHDLLPSYFKEERKQSSEIWGKELHFNKGEYIKIVAPSGRGKTSLMHFLFGIRKEYSGSVNYDERVIKALNPEDFASYRNSLISIVFQDMRLFPNQTVNENIEIKRQLNPYHSSDMIFTMAERLGIGDKLNSKCSTCSYGEQQRVAIIRALMQPYDFLLLDEPFSHLDEQNSQIAMKLMLEESEKRKAAIIF